MKRRQTRCNPSIKNTSAKGGTHKTVNSHNSSTCCDCSCIFNQTMITYDQLNKLIFGKGDFVMVETVLLILILTGLFVFLYNQGYMVLKSTSAVTFIGSTRGNSARFTSCSGYMKRIIRFKADGTYTFLLDAELSKGDMSIELLDSAKQKIMLLNCANRSASITVEKKKKYYLVIDFKSATGRYALIRE